jgi:hypothetical protein
MANPEPLFHYRCEKWRADFIRRPCEHNLARIKALTKNAPKAHLGPLEHCRECRGKGLITLERREEPMQKAVKEQMPPAGAQDGFIWPDGLVTWWDDKGKNVGKANIPGWETTPNPLLPSEKPEKATLETDALNLKPAELKTKYGWATREASVNAMVNAGVSAAVAAGVAESIFGTAPVVRGTTPMSPSVGPSTVPAATPATTSTASKLGESEKQLYNLALTGSKITLTMKDNALVSIPFTKPAPPPPPKTTKPPVK